MTSTANILALSGGVGGAKLALGLAHEVAADKLTIVANTADDFEHWGLSISPDLDTVMYTLADLNNKEQGWGLANETWQSMQAMQRLQGETWFRLGDQDIATHILRSQWLREGKTLTQVTQSLCERLSIKPCLLPMCNESVSTIVQTDNGNLAFQRYFVEQQCAPTVTGFTFEGIEKTQLSSELAKAINAMDALIICPSNPFVSIAPILAVNGVKKALLEHNVPRIVVSPIVSGMAIKGPAAKMMRELNMPVNALSVAEYYQGFATHFVLDAEDQSYCKSIEKLGYTVMITNTVMHSLSQRQQLARDILAVLV
jgi:LPPG:FO 2-phospho-L-lactate transferase